MGLFGKKRTGHMESSKEMPNCFTWRIPDFTKYATDIALDSEQVSLKKAKFYLHLAIDKKGNIGLYINYKSPPIPKYSYFFENTKGEVMRQHTAHTIPPGTHRCGHWNVCSRSDMIDFLKDEDVLLIHLKFDDDTVKVEYPPEGVAVTWSIPNFLSQNLNPFSSPGVHVKDTLLVVRIDIKREGNPITKYNPDTIQNFIFFLFSRRGKVYPHSIELLDDNGTSYAKVERNTENVTQALIVDKSIVDTHLPASRTMNVKVVFFTGGNPLESLNQLSQQHNNTPLAGDLAHTVEQGEGKELYTLMDD